MTTEWLAGMAARGNAPAIIEDAHTLVYEELFRRIEDRALDLRAAGVTAGDTVVLNSDYSIEGISLLFALASLGAIVAPITTLTDAAIETMRESCGARFICRPDDGPLLETWQGGGGGAVPVLYERLRERRAAGLILLSSGSTGRPKAILHDLDALLMAKTTARASRHLRILLLLMFDHIGGVNTLVNTLFSGGTAVVTPQRTPEMICKLIQTHKIQVLPGNPTFLNLILLGGFNQRFDLSSLRLITYGTEPMPENLLTRLHATFPRVRMLQTFGTSETGIAATQSASSDSVRFRISDSTYEYRVVGGELQLRSKSQFLGYLNYSNSIVTDDGWFCTGDLVQQEEDGYLRILGRAKEIINVGGEKVLPLEIESLLLEHPMVADCVVYGEGNAITGQAVCAEIRTRGVVERGDLRRQLQAFLGAKVERFKVPSRIKMVEAIETSERFKKRRIRT